MSDSDFDYKQRAILGSIPLMSLSSANMPDGCASGCMVRFARKILLLTVAHATGDNGRWSMFLRYDPERKRTEQWVLPQWNYLAAFSLRGKKKPKLHDVDFAYAEVDHSVTPFHQALDDKGLVLHQQPKIVFPSEAVAPSPDESYCFYGLAQGELDDAFRLRSWETFVEGMTFVGEEAFLLRFRCKERYFSHNDYKGCSGAPIIDSKGNLVSLVVEGSDDRWEVRGINLRKVWAALLVTAGE